MIQSLALSILKTGANVFLTGEPGSGKTYLVNQYVAYLRSVGIEPAITASTGIAATHIGGMTIHSWSGIGIKTKLDKHDLNKIVLNKYIAKRVRNAKVLIIDEISMLLPGMLSMIDVVCREIKQEPKPFGGAQVVLVGDFFQLPPIVRRAEDGDSQAKLIEELPAFFAYDSPSWAKLNPTICYLTEQYRQDDSNFLEILSSIRRNIFDANHLRHIETRKIEYLSAPTGVPKFFLTTLMLIASMMKCSPSFRASQKHFYVFAGPRRARGRAEKGLPFAGNAFSQSRRGGDVYEK